MNATAKTTARKKRGGFTLIELLIVIAIIAILAVAVVITLNPAEMLAQGRDANRLSDLSTFNSAMNLYNEDAGGSVSFGTAGTTYISIPDPTASPPPPDRTVPHSVFPRQDITVPGRTFIAGTTARAGYP